MLQPKISFIFTNLDPSRKKSLTPSLRKAKISPVKTQPLCLLVSGNLEDEALHINSPIKLFGSELDTGVQLQYSFFRQSAWLDTNDSWKHRIIRIRKKQTLDVGDGVAISNLSDINITALSDCEFILFDLP